MLAQQQIRKNFAAAFAAVSFAVGGLGSALAAPPPESKGRELTAGETEMLKMFGSEINPAIARLHAGPSKGNTMGEAFDPRTVALYGHPYLSLDYSKDDPSYDDTKNADNWGLYYHELTHTWQFQNGWAFTKGHCPGGYKYRLNPNSKFDNYCSEAQGAIIQDYSRRFLKPKSSPSYWFVVMCKKDTLEHDAMLLKVVETRFPGARDMRVKLGRGEVLPDAIKTPEGSPCPGPNDDDTDGGGETPLGKKGQPVYFCETLAYAFKNIHGIAFKEGLPAWPGFEAELDKKEPTCKVSIYGSPLSILGAKDFSNGQIKAGSMGTLAQSIVKYTPQGIVEPVRNNLSALFDNLVDKQKAEIKALLQIKTKEHAERVLTALETQLADDPSLPDNSRGFVEEKVRIVKEILRKLKGGPDTQPKPTGPKPDGGDNKGGGKPDGGSKPGTGGNGKGGNGGDKPADGTSGKPDNGKPDNGKPDAGKPDAAKPPVKQPPQPIGGTTHGADKNIKELLDSAFGKPVPPAKSVGAKGP